MYEGYARNYALLMSPIPEAERAEPLRRLADELPAGAAILEVGSGTGRDADYLEAFGFDVRRTDATEAFLQIQADRGKHADRLDLIDDDLGGPYNAVVAMCVLIHIDPRLIDDVLAKIRTSLVPGGSFLVSMREGVGEEGSEEGTWYTTLWSSDDFEARLRDIGFHVSWTSRHEDGDGDIWLTYLASMSA
jgi:SAM-dependent methyltransferase